MLLTYIQDVSPGMKAGSLIIHPGTPDLVLLKAGAEMDERILRRLGELGVRQIWVEHEQARDLDGAVPEGITAVKVESYKVLKAELRQAARTTSAAEQVKACHGAAVSLVKALSAAGEFPGLADQLCMAGGDLFSHSVNVAHISTMVGLKMKAYTLRQRSRRSSRKVGDEVELALGALLHDLGKLALDPRSAEHHEIAAEDGIDVESYRRHVDEGYQRLQGNTVRPIVRSIVLNHHQRYDGTGWPDLSAPTRGRRRGRLVGRRIHVFSRIVAAANVLENLMRGVDGTRRPPVAALCDFAGRRFDGWFDPAVRRAMLRNIPPFAVGSRVDLSDGRAAVVVANSPRRPCRPTVRPLVTPGGAEVPGGAAPVDLGEHRDLHVARYAGEPVAQWLYDLPPADAARRSAA